MTETAHESARRWLDAERRSTLRGDGPQLLAAERALRELMLQLPEARPRPDFARRVLDAAGLGLDTARHPALTPAWRWALQSLLAVCLLRRILSENLIYIQLIHGHVDHPYLC